jgi:hypothetical protein
MEEAGVQLRLAAPEDAEQIRQVVRFTLANPEGRSVRKRYEDAIARSEVLVLTRYEPREKANRIQGFIEWHTRVDGPVTIRDMGSVGDTPNQGILKWLLRELVRMLQPPSASAKVRADQVAFVDVFRETPGFEMEGQEYTRPHWRQIWTWTPQTERSALGPATRRPAGVGANRQPPARRRGPR